MLKQMLYEEKKMSILELFVLAIGLSMDAFAVSICKGLSQGRTKIKNMCIVGLWFGGFQALMPLVGYFLGGFFADVVTKYAHWIAFVLLLFIGGKMIAEACRDLVLSGGDGQAVCKVSEGGEMSMDAKTMFPLAVATSIDALAVGVTFAFLKVSIIPAVSFIGVITFLCSAAGVKIGSIFGSKYKAKAELGGGIILLLIGIKILLNGLNII